MPLMLASAVGAVDEDRTAQYLTFALGGESFGVPIERVREILEYMEPTPIPMVPSFLSGVINLRGAVVPVIDLQSRFGKGATEAGHRSCIVIVEVEHDGLKLPLGILVDSVREVVGVDRSRLEPRPSFGTRIRPDFVAGILRMENHFVITLDLKQILSIEELATLIGMAFGSRKN